MTIKVSLAQTFKSTTSHKPILALLDRAVSANLLVADTDKPILGKRANMLIFFTQTRIDTARWSGSHGFQVKYVVYMI